MKIDIVYASLFLLIIGCAEKSPEKEYKQNQLPEDSTAQVMSPVDTVNVARIDFENTQHDFGKIKAGDVVKHAFEFTNGGKAPLLISDAKGSCGCTIPEYPKNPIAPGEKGEILVQFNSKNKSGLNNKVVTITANTWPEVTTISIKADVEATDESIGPLAQ